MRRQDRTRLNHTAAVLTFLAFSGMGGGFFVQADEKGRKESTETSKEHGDGDEKRSDPSQGRRARRISTYAPPTMPHEAGPVKECLECHASHESGAPKMPHRVMPNCRQCHVPQEEVPLFRGNQFKGEGDLVGGTRVAQGAPPMMPHRVFMREDCLACHAEEARADIKHTPHQTRLRCQQCHVEQHSEAAPFPRKDRYNVSGTRAEKKKL